MPRHDNISENTLIQFLLIIKVICFFAHVVGDIILLYLLMVIKILSTITDIFSCFQYLTVLTDIIDLVGNCG